MGNYVQFQDINPYEFTEKASFQDYFKTKKELSCNVCALGSCFVSLVNLKNKCSVEDMFDECKATDMTFKRLEPLFGPENLTMMESAFECDYMENFFEANVSEEVLEAAIEWGYQWTDSNERLRQIMLNIIRNNGDFKLPKRLLEKARREEKANAW